MVSGECVSTFAEASHVVCDGNLDNPFFRNVAIQQITRLGGRKLTTDLGDYAIRKQRGKECVEVLVRDPIFGNQTVYGRPFKDANTPPIGNRFPLFPENTDT